MFKNIVKLNYKYVILKNTLSTSLKHSWKILASLLVSVVSTPMPIRSLGIRQVNLSLGIFSGPINVPFIL